MPVDPPPITRMSVEILFIGSSVHFPIDSRHEPAHRLGVVQLQGFLRQAPGHRHRLAQDRLLGRRDAGRRHAEFVETQPKQDRDRIGVGRPVRRTGRPNVRAGGRRAGRQSIWRSMAGCSGSTRPATRWLVRSAAKVYCVRSLVPMLKKSTSGARWSAISTAAGVSIMMPTGTSALKGMPAAASSLAALAMSACARRISLDRADHGEHDLHIAGRRLHA